MREGEFPLVSQNRWFKYLPEQTNNIYPILASYGMTMLKEAGHDIRFIDAPTEGMSLTVALEEASKYDLVVLEGRTAIINWIHKIASDIKHLNMDTKIAIYGDHVMASPFASKSYCDYLIQCGDYDWGVFKLVQMLESGSPRRYSKQFFCSLMTEDELTNLPYVDRDIVPWKSYFEAWRHREDFGWMQSSRGCPYHCTFCSWVETFYKRTIRFMSPKRVVDEMLYANERYGINEYLDDCDTFMQWYGAEMVKELHDSGLDVFWNVQTRADQIKDVVIWKAMNAYGLHVVKIGADGGSDYTLDLIKKGHTIQQTRDAVKKLKKAGCEVHINMIIGYPWETKRAAYEVIRFVKSLKPNQAQFSLIQPFVGTEIYAQALKEDWFAVDPEDWDRWNMKEPILKGEMSTKEIKKLHKDAWRMFYITPSFVVSQLLKSTKLSFKERSFDSFRHLWRGYKGVRMNMEAME